MNSACQAAFQTVVVRPFQRRLLSMQNMKFGLLGLCILRKICLFFAKLLSLLSHKSSKTKFVLYKFCASSQKFYYNKNLRVLILLNQKAKKILKKKKIFFRIFSKKLLCLLEVHPLTLFRVNWRLKKEGGLVHTHYNDDPAREFQLGIFDTF